MAQGTLREHADLMRSAIKTTSLTELLEIAQYVTRGYFLRSRLSKCGRYLQAGKNIRVIRKNSDIEFGDHVKIFPHVKLSVYGTDYKASLKIGSYTSIGDRAEIHCGKEITIGNNCLLAWDVVIMDRDYHKLNSPIAIYKPVRIEDRVWVGARATILKGVHIGTGSVVAAGSVVTRDVPENVLVAGNPAKVVKTNIYWSP